jgi:hypothetical protein
MAYKINDFTGVDSRAIQLSLHEVSATCVFLSRIGGFIGAFFALMLSVDKVLRS